MILCTFDLLLFLRLLTTEHLSVACDYLAD